MLAKLVHPAVQVVPTTSRRLDALLNRLFADDSDDEPTYSNRSSRRDLITDVETVKLVSALLAIVTSSHGLLPALGRPVALTARLILVRFPAPWGVIVTMA
jgi:hypothetical protein